MPNQTENYHLQKPMPEDFYDIEVQNENMDTIDTQLKKLDVALETKAEIGADGKIPVDALPDMDYIPTAQKGSPEGVATLGLNGRVPEEQLPPLNYIPMADKGAPEGVASLDEGGKIPKRQIPELAYDTMGSAEAVAQVVEEHTMDTTLHTTLSAVGEQIAAHNVSDLAHGDVRTSIVGLESRIKNIELIVGGGISTNPFSITFTSLSGMNVIGVWNKEQGRIEF